MKKFVAIIGLRNSGKSTIIQSLTGCKSRGFEDYVYDEETHNSVYVVASSPQENPKTREKIHQILNSVLNKSGCAGCIIAIQPSQTRKRISMEDIFTVVKAIGSFQIFAFILHPTRDNQNVNVQEIRSRLANFNVRIEILDARKFSHFNATRIQNITNILE